MILLFWIAVALILYTYVVYPLAIAGLATLVRRAPPVAAATDIHVPKVSLIMAVRNEAGRVATRVAELLGHMDRYPACDELIVVSDGSTDETSTILAALKDARLKVISLPANVGKSRAISIGAESARSEVLAFADVRQTWTVDTLPNLVRQLADPRIGGASGDLVLTDSRGGAQSVGLYWRYEKWIRRCESRVHSTVGVSGSVAAVRRRLFRGIPAGTILDDVYWPMDVVMQGFRVVHEERAIAIDSLPGEAAAEFRRKVRTLSGNFQLLQIMPGLLVPWRNPLYWQFLSHKVARLIVPWAMIAAILSSALTDSAVYQWLFVAQLLVLLLATGGLFSKRIRALPGVSALASLLLLNLAASVGLCVWVTGRSSRTWIPTHYPKLPK